MHARNTVAKRHTWQVANHVAVAKALRYAACLRRKGKTVIISLPSATTARDLSQTREGETRPSTSHRGIASNNCYQLQQLGAHVKINVDGTSPLRLQSEAEHAAHSGDLRAHVYVPGPATRSSSLWD